MEERLASSVVAPSGACIAGPTVRWNGRQHCRRKDRHGPRHGALSRFARRLPIDFPDDKTLRISHEAIYQALFVQGRGVLRSEFPPACERERVARAQGARTRAEQGLCLAGDMMSERPAEAADRALPGHWEGDLILGLGSSAIGTLVERTTRFTMLLHFPG